jgi:flagellar basal-body rod protein FlgF
VDKLIYTAMTGASHTMNQQAAVSQNLANTNTPGFRAAINTFRAVPLQGEGLPTRAFVVDSTAGADFSSGVMEATGRPLDVAVNGEGWIAVQAQDGSEAYTRNGSLQLTTSGLLQTRSGGNVLGDAGPITIPPESKVTIAQDGTVFATAPGSGAAEAVAVGRLKLTNPPQNTLLRGDDGMFRSNNGKPVAADANVNVMSGFLESSNVNAVETMVNMISLARQFDMQMKMLTTADNNARQASKILSSN